MSRRILCPKLMPRDQASLSIAAACQRGRSRDTSTTSSSRQYTPASAGCSKASSIMVLTPSEHLDIVRQDGEPCSLHDHVLGELLRVIGMSLAAQDDSLLAHHQPQLLDPPAQPAVYERFQCGGLIGGGEVRAVLECTGCHG